MPSQALSTVKMCEVIHVTDDLNLDHLAIHDVCQNYLFNITVFKVIITTYYFETMQTLFPFRLSPDHLPSCRVN